MGENNRALSLKGLLITVVMFITTVALLLSMGISLYSQIANYKDRIVNEVTTVAELVGNSASTMILEGDNIREEQHLDTLKAADFVQNLHIYQQDENGELTFFASYNKTGQAPIPSMTHRLEELSQPTFSEDVLELITPIYRQQDLIGYTYVRASTESLTTLIINTALIAVSVLLVALLLSLALTLRMQRSVTKPIQDLVGIVQHVATQKDYRLRAEHSSLKELDILAKAFNQMLERIQQHIKAQEEAEDEYRRLNLSLEEKVNSRTTALKEANKELIDTLEKLHQFQRQIVQNEKMASLGDMVAGVAHEVNTPIGLGVTASTMMLDRLHSLEEDFKAKQLKASSLAKFIQESDENLNIIYRNLNRAAELISSFKQVAVDQTSENTRVFRFTQLMDEILMSLRPKLKKVKHDININCDPNLTIESKAGPINQVMINLIMNSLIHGFEFVEHGQIDIDVTLDDRKQLNIVYKDNGKGIPEDMCKRIFDPFVTTKRGQGGSGLGLHLVYNLITQALNGSISVSSEENKGTEFVIRFPVTSKNEA